MLTPPLRTFIYYHPTFQWILYRKLNAKSRETDRNAYILLKGHRSSSAGTFCYGRVIIEQLCYVDNLKEIYQQRKGSASQR